MAAGDITIRIDSETKAFRQGVEAGIIQPLDDADKALDDLGKTRGPEQLERELKDAQRATEKLGDETKATADRIEREFRDTYKGVGRDGADGLGKVKEGAQELQQEIGQNLGETVSSFRGDLSDLGQIGQDTLGGLAATVAGAGPAGLLGAFALAAGALGLGAFTAGLTEADEKQRALKESAAEWATAYEASAGRIVAATSVVSAVQDIATDSEKYDTAKKNAQDWGVTVSTAMLAMAGDATAMELAQDGVNKKAAEFDKLMADSTNRDGFYKGTQETTDKLHEMGETITRGNESLAAQREAMKLGQAIAADQARALYDYALRAGEATGETDGLKNAIYKLPDGKEIVVDAKTKTAYDDLEAVEKRGEQVARKPVNIPVTVDDSAVRNWRPPMIRIPTRLDAPRPILD